MNSAQGFIGELKTPKRNFATSTGRKSSAFKKSVPTGLTPKTTTNQAKPQTQT